MPVNSFGPFPALRVVVPQVLIHAQDLHARQAVLGRRPTRRARVAIASQTVCQSTPSRRAIEATEALSRWMQLIAHHAARLVSFA